MSLILRRMAAVGLVVFALFQGASAGAVEQMAIIGDAGQAGPELDALRESLNEEKVKSLILPGDNLYLKNYETVWNPWKEDEFLFDIVAIGNHNLSYKAEVKYFGMPAEFYSVVKNGARFIVLNSDNTKTVSAQMDFLKNELNTATEKLIFLVYHHPTFTVSHSHKWTEKREFQLAMRKILKTYKDRISALLLGHDHLTSFLTFGDIPVVVAGSGREVRREPAVSFTEDGFKIQTQYLAPRKQHWALLEIDSHAQTAVIHFVRVHDQHRSCSAMLAGNRMSLASNCEQ